MDESEWDMTFQLIWKAYDAGFSDIWMLEDGLFDGPYVIPWELSVCRYKMAFPVVFRLFS